MAVVLIGTHYWMYRQGKKSTCDKIRSEIDKQHEEHLEQIFADVDSVCPDASNAIIILHKNREEAMRSKDA